MADALGAGVIPGHTRRAADDAGAGARPAGQLPLDAHRLHRRLATHGAVVEDRRLPATDSRLTSDGRGGAAADREYFRTIPADLINAARVDGAHTLDVIVHVVVPASRPILVTLALITVVSQWNNFMWPLVITSGSKWEVLTVATAGLQSRYNAQWTLVMAATTVAIVPLIVLFVVLGRHIVRSIVVTGLK